MSPSLIIFPPSLLRKIEPLFSFIHTFSAALLKEEIFLLFFLSPFSRLNFQEGKKVGFIVKKFIPRCHKIVVSYFIIHVSIIFIFTHMHTMTTHRRNGKDQVSIINPQPIKLCVSTRDTTSLFTHIGIMIMVYQSLHIVTKQSQQPNVG